MAGKQGKRLKKAYEVVGASTVYPLDGALKLVKSQATAKFDEMVEISVNLGVDTQKSDQQVRGAVVMPGGLGKQVRVAVFAQGEKAEEAKKAGADIVGSEELAEQVKKGDLDFERCIATPDMMPLVGKVGKILGPRGLMPNPKLGTVTPDVAEAVKAAKSGQVEFRAEKAGIIHAGIGKVSFDEKTLRENIVTFIDAVNKARPKESKGVYLKKVTLSSTMGPGIAVEVGSLAA